MSFRPGQAALIVTLVVIVGLTVAVAVISRSVTDVGVSTQEEDRARSFSAAEAGVEDALRQDLSTIAGGNFQVGGQETTTNYTVTKLTNVTARIDPGQVLTIDWSKGTGTTAAVKFATNKGEISLAGADFKKIFNLRAPGRISLKSNLFNIEKK